MVSFAETRHAEQRHSSIPQGMAIELKGVVDLMKRLFAGLALAAIAAGCNTVVISSPGSLRGIDVNGADGRADRVLSISNEGYFLFHCLPIFTGSMRWNPVEKRIRNDFEFFSNHLAGDKMMAAMCRYADSLDCDLVDIVVIDKNDCPLGLMGIQDWINTLIAYRDITYSGVLCPRRKAGKEAVGK